MTPLQAYIILFSIYGVLLAMIIALITILARNRILLNVDQWSNGSLMNATVRCRIKNNKIYSMWDVFSRKPIVPNALKVVTGMMHMEGLPWIGVNKTINVFINEDDNYYCWFPPEELPTDDVIKNIRTVMINQIRKEIYESTDNTTNMDLVYKLVLPMAIVVLAAMCIIFFPKIYSSIMEQSSAALQSAKVGWEQMFDSIKPPG